MKRKNKIIVITLSMIAVMFITIFPYCWEWILGKTINYEQIYYRSR